ncbi:MAG: B12-binding domain-containing protein [Pseudomonadota bacterium]
MSFPKIPWRSGAQQTALQGIWKSEPRLGQTQPNQSGSRQISPAEARKFAELPLRLEADHLLGEMDEFLAQGVAINSICVDLLAPAARRLGELWEQDQCDFVDVTMGLWRLQEVLHEISARAPYRSKAVAPGAKRGLFLSMPGDQHFLGPQVLEDVFVNAGWYTAVLTKPLRRDILALLSRECFDVVALTLSRDCPSSAVRSIVNAMRSVSRNEHISILVGGHMINHNPAIVAEVGADGTGADARAALKMAEALVQSAEVRAQTLR